MKLLVIGSEGFIGRNVVNYFGSKGAEVVGCDLCETPSTHYRYTRLSGILPDFDGIIKGELFDACINASGSGNVNFSVTNPVDDFRANTFDTITILDAFRKYNTGCKYLHISSAAVYGNPVSNPINEENECKPLSPYGWHKLMAEQLCKEYHLLYHLPVVIVRPFSIYGPGLKKQLFWDLYTRFSENPKLIEIWGNGDESRDFIYIDDVVRCFEILLQHDDMKAGVYNIASGVETTIQEAVRLLFNNVNVPPELHFNNIERKGDPLNWHADITKLLRLGCKPSTNLKEGIRKLSDWLFNQNAV